MQSEPSYDIMCMLFGIGEKVMDLIGRKVHVVSGAMHPVKEGRVYLQDADRCWVDFSESGELPYVFAKYRLLCSEVPEFEVPDACGVYLIAE